MEFFDKKEEVMEIQLTSYGKELISKGNFKPFYYAFFDEGILYDGARANVTENQNDIQNRIKNLTPRIKNTAEYLSPEQIAKSQELVPDEGEIREIPMFDFDVTYENQLGSSANNLDKAPAWKISVLQSEITGSSIFLTASSTSRVLPIAQINLDQDSIKYETSISYDGEGSSGRKCDINTVLTAYKTEFPDGTVLNIEEAPIMIKIEEENTLSRRDNFEIELFEVIENNESQAVTTKTKFLRPLKFFKFKQQVVDGILQDDGYDLGNTGIQNLDRIDDTFVSNYLELSVDNGS